MPHLFPSDAWAKAFMEKLNTSAAYGETAKNWEGDICFVVEPDTSALPQAMTLYMDLWHGQCRAAGQIANPEEKQAAFILTGTLGAYTKILTGQLDPMQAMLTRRLKVKGSMIILMRNVPTVLEFVRTASQVDTEFPQ